MPELEVSPATLALLGRIAGAIRDELGEEIDAYPGCRSPEGADPINRLYRAVVRRLVELDQAPSADTAPLVSGALRRLAEARLAEGGRDDQEVKSLIEDEPGGPDDWLAFLILGPHSQIGPILDPDDD